MKILLHIFITSLFFTTQFSFAMYPKDRRRHSAPARRKIYHSPGTYRREFSPRGTTLYLTKEDHPENKPIVVKLNPQNKFLHQQTKESNDTNDQDNKKLCNKE